VHLYGNTLWVGMRLIPPAMLRRRIYHRTDPTIQIQGAIYRQTLCPRNQKSTGLSLSELRMTWGHSPTITLARCFFKVSVTTQTKSDELILIFHDSSLTRRGCLSFCPAGFRVHRGPKAFAQVPCASYAGFSSLWRILHNLHKHHYLAIYQAHEIYGLHLLIVLISTSLDPTSHH
jgi:hypothetical protein